MTEATDRTVVVVGAGLGGLAAAIEAADRGRRVVLLEARSGAGGRARTAVRDGFALNEGPHALYPGGPLSRLLDQLGLDPSAGTPDVTPGIGIDGAVSGQLPSGPMSVLRSPLIRGERLRFGKVLGRLERLDVSAYDDVTVADALTGLLGAGRSRRLGEALVRVATYAHDPDRASAGAALGQVKRAAETGVRYLDGGWQTLVDGLRAEAVGRGVEIRDRAKVSLVREDHDHVEVVVEDGSLRAGSVVLAVGGPRSVRDLLADPPPEVDGWLDRARPSTVAVLDVGLGTGWGAHPPFALGIDRPLYLSLHAPVAELAPEGASLVSTMRYHHPDESPDADADRAELEGLLDRVRPGWRGDAVHVQFRRRLVAAHDIPRASEGGFRGRPSVAVPRRRRLFVGGDWVGAEGFLSDAVVASSRAAAAAAAERVVEAVPA